MAKKKRKKDLDQEFIVPFLGQALKFGVAGEWRGAGECVYRMGTGGRNSSKR